MKEKHESEISIEEKAEALYDQQLYYHNFEHAKQVTEAAMEIAKRCNEEGVEVDERAVYYAMLFHDAGYHEDHTALEFDSKEAYSASLAEQYLLEVGLDEDTIEKVKETIMGTKPDAPFTTNEQKVARAADLTGFMADYDTFLLNAVRIKLEYEYLHDTEVPWDIYQHEQVRIITEHYLEQDIHLTSAYEDDSGNSVWHTKTKTNLDKFLDEDPNVLEDLANEIRHK